MLSHTIIATSKTQVSLHEVGESQAALVTQFRSLATTPFIQLQEIKVPRLERLD